MKSKHRKAFSLIEILIAFTVLTITVISAVALLSSTISNNSENILRLQAYNLAQQGLEGVRNIRDSNWNLNQNFDTKNTAIWGELAAIFPDGESQDITIEPITNATTKGVGPSLGAPWKISPANSTNTELFVTETGENLKSYTHSSTGEESPFKRVITISRTFEDIKKVADETPEIEENNLIVVTSKVSYEFKGKEKEIKLSTILTDWKEGPL